MKDTELQRMKARALYAVYVKGLEDGRFESMFEAGKWCAAHPAPCFFISAKRAAILVSRILSKISLINLNASNRRLIWSLHNRYKQYLADHPGNTLSRERVMEILVDQPAPEFFMTGECARKILRNEVRKARRAKGW